MNSTYSQELLDHLRDGQLVAHAPYLYLIQLQSGLTLTATNGQDDVVGAGEPPTTYFAQKMGLWSHDKKTHAADTRFSANTMNLTINAGNNIGPVKDLSQVFFPGTNINLLTAARKRLFDQAKLTMFRCFFPSRWNDLSLGIVTQFIGEIANFSELNRTKATFVVTDPLFRCNVQVPKKIISRSCPYILFDSDCNKNGALDPGPFTVFNVVQSVDASGITINLANPLPHFIDQVGNPYYDQGRMWAVSGENVSMDIRMIKKQNSVTQLVLDQPFPFPLLPGDQLNIRPGCNKLSNTCNLKFGNLVNIGSTEFVPHPEVRL